MVNRYSFNIEWSEEDQEYVATCPAFPGLSAFGLSEEEALREGKIALEGFVETCEANHIPLPEPQVHETYSGQTRLRLPKSLHRQAAAMAQAEEISLNQYMVDAVRLRVTGEQVAAKALTEVRRCLNETRTQSASVLTVQPIARYSQEITKKTSIEQPVFLGSGERGKGNC